ncbi:hypothetical protein ACIBUY_03155 [Streptomyces sp. NPDC050085]|uniref:hypothetical protein n=1 Tax=Streptomyces sp. NPDC050085 TaxID=3365600 RepID=UPI0037A015C8
MAGTYNWETALATYSTAAPTSRMEIGGSGEGYASWFDKTHFYLGDSSGASEKASDYDLWMEASWTFTGFNTTTYYFRMGIRLSRLVGTNDADTPLYKFVHEPIEWLEPALTEGGSEVIKLHSFDDAGMAVRGTQQFLDQWAQKFKGWADGVDVADADFQGTAAGSFKNMLLGIHSELTDVVRQMTIPADWTAEVDAARTQLVNTTTQLHAAHAAWLNTPESMPINVLRPVFGLTAMGFYGYLNDSLTNGGGLATALDSAIKGVGQGDPKDQGFWDRMQETAKNGWLAHVGSMLDPAAQQSAGALDEAYLHTSEDIRDIVPPQWLTPPYGAGAAGSGDAGGAAGSGGSGDLGGSTGPDGTGTSLGGNQQGGGADPTGDDPTGAGTGADTGQDQQGGVHSNGVAGSGLTGPTTGTGKDTGLGGGVTGNGVHGNGLNSGETYNAGNLPPGSTVTSNGTVIGPNGQVLKNPDGSTVKVPPGTKVTGSGLDTGKRTSDSLKQQAQEQERLRAQELKAQQEAQKQAEAQQRQYQQALDRARRTVRSSGIEEKLNGGGGGGNLSYRTKNADGTFSARDPLTGEVLPAGTSKVRTSSVEPSAAAAAAEEAAAARGQRTSSQSPMMPGSGAGAGAGAGQGQDRDRKSYLDEDEDTWGTAECTSTGVIG